MILTWNLMRNYKRSLSRGSHLNAEILDTARENAFMEVHFQKNDPVGGPPFVSLILFIFS